MNRKFIAMEVLMAGTGIAIDRFKIRNAMSEYIYISVSLKKETEREIEEKKELQAGSFFCLFVCLFV